MAASSDQLMEAFNWPEAWSQQNADGSYTMTDPVSREPLDPTRPPLWIADDPNMVSDLDYLRTHGNAVTIDLAFTNGESTTEQLGEFGEDFQGDWFEEAVRGADYFGAALGNVEADHQYVVAAAVQLNLDASLRGDNNGDLADFYREADRQGVGDTSEYDLRILRAVARNVNTTESFSYLPAADGTPVEQAILQGMDTVLSLPSTPASSLALIGLENAARWCGAVRTGRVVRIGEGGQLSANNPVRVLELRDVHHGDMGRIYNEVLGVKANALFVNGKVWLREAIDAATLTSIAARGGAYPLEVPATQRRHQKVREQFFGEGE